MAAKDPAVLRASAALQLSKELESEQEYAGAITALNEFMCDHKNRVWIKQHDEAMVELIRLSMQERSLTQLGFSMQQYRRRAMNVNPEMIEDMVTKCLQAAEDEITKAEDKAEAEANTDANILNFIHSISGTSPAENLKERFVSKAINFYMEVVKQMLKALRLILDSNKKLGGKQLVVFFHKTVQHALNILVKKNSSYELEGFCRYLHKNVFENMTRHKDFFDASLHSEEAVTAVLNTKYTQLRAATELKCWRLVSNTIQSTNDLTKLINNNEKPMKRSSYLTNFLYMAKLFKDCSMPAFHSNCMINAAKLTIRTEGVTEEQIRDAASQAVLSVLCIPIGTDAPDAVTQGQDIQRENMVKLARDLSMSAAPTRSSLSLELNDLIDYTYPEVRGLYDALFRVNSINVCRTTKPLLEKISENEILARYADDLRQIAIEVMLEVAASSYAKLPIPYFMELCAFYEANEYHNKVEPILLRVAHNERGTNTVRVDMKNQQLLFVAAASRTEERVVAFANQLQHAAALCAPHVASKKAAAGFKVTKSTLDDIEAERDRVLMRNRLAKARTEKKEERLDNQKKRELQKKKDEQDRIKKLEEDRHRANLENHKKRIAGEIAALEAVERRKWVLKAIIPKNKGIELPSKLAELSQDKFADEMVKRLTTYRRNMDNRKNTDLRAMDHFERACREEEIPKREQLELEQREAFEKQRMESASNQRAQHRAAHEIAVETKQLLSKFQKDRKAEEDLVFASAQKSGKISKRDQEEENLRQEKEKLAAAAAVPKEKPAPAPQQQAAPAADAAPAKAAWKPKARN